MTRSTAAFLAVLLLAAPAAARASAWPEPAAEAKPWVYNWWMGSAVDEAGLRLQIAEMKKVGLGGMHVIPIYAAKNSPGDRTLLSPEWLAAFGTAVRLAKEAGLGVDLTTGSGWCFGGPQLAPEEGCWMLEVDTKRPAASRVLWRGRKDGKDVVLSVRPTGQQVKRAGPGGRGPMMNPLSAAAMASFLKPFAAAFGAPDAPKPGCMYHDSYEYFQAGWSPELPAAFAARRGYRLEDHYAELAGVGDPDAIARVKCDYRETLSEMMVEDVFAPWADWCRAHGMKTRNEAHGAPANWLDFYALADVPETEMFSCDKTRARRPEVSSAFMNSGDRDVLVSKFASSAAHVKHAGAARDPLVSAESCTWIAEHFCETPGAVKTFLDRLFLAGVNHVFYHGMCYSPADAKWPGWTFYASCEMNRFNPLWASADVLNAYVARVQSVAQSRAIDNDVLVYWPLHDYWMDAGGFERQLTVHARDWLGGQSVGKIARRLLDDGYAFDFVSEKQLKTLPARGAGPYTTIVVPGAKAMKGETFARLAELADGGYEVLFVDGFPATVPGWKDVPSREDDLKRRIAAAKAVRAGSYEELMAKSVARKEPFNKAAGLMYTRHVKDGVTSYFLANQYNDAGVKGRFRPNAPCRSAVLKDPLSGECRALEVAEGAFELDLPIGQSAIVEVSGAEGSLPPARGAEPAIPVALDGAWTRTAVSGGPEFPAAASGRLPLPWGRTAAFPEGAFCGTMRYATTFALPEDGGRRTGCAFLDLGKVAHAAKVYVNGTYAGAAIMPPYRVKVPAELLKPGSNELAVDVTSTGSNRLKWLDTAKPYEWKVFTDINMVDIDYKKLDASVWEQQEYGLYGPVTLAVNPGTGISAKPSPRP